jgi:hypothetical protein
MKRTLSVVCFLVILVTLSGACSRPSPSRFDYPVRAVPFVDVDIADGFWTPRLENNRTITVPFLFSGYEKRKASDSRLIEAGAYLLARRPDPNFQRRVAAMLDRALENYRRRVPGNRWNDLLDGELYAAGHFFEAAVAFHQATGDRTYLDAAAGIADDIGAVFGPDKRRDVSQHEEVKIGLVRLARQTSRKTYLDLAKYFLDERGYSRNGRILYGDYAQDHKPVLEQERAIGHAVRAMYLYVALTDLAAYTGEAGYGAAARRIWDDAVSKRTYLTGGVGTYRDFEDFGDDYELPNLGCWNEICAAVGNVLWNHRLFLLNRDGKYIDMLERILYNGLLAGVSLTGDTFLYQAPLKAYGSFARQPWFGPNCCPPNLARTLAHLGDFIYAVGPDDEVFVNLFIGSRARVKTRGSTIAIAQETSYPWDGNVRISVDPEDPRTFALKVRVPGWAQERPMPGGLYRYAADPVQPVAILINGRPANIAIVNGFAEIKREWEKGDLVDVRFPMAVRRILADDRVADDRGMVALEHGPIVYCAEGVDNGGRVFNLLIPDAVSLTFAFDRNILGGIGTIRGSITALDRAQDRVSLERRSHDLLAIPYYAFANRDTGEMAVWLASVESRALPPSAATLASTARLSSSCGSGSIADNYPGRDVPAIAKRFFPGAQDGSGDLNAAVDQSVPLNSLDGSSTYLRLRPQSGDKAWVECGFPTAERVSSVEVYWKDNKEYCLVPKAWRLLYKDGNDWKPVLAETPYGVEKDRFNRVSFKTIFTSGLRLDIELQGKTFKKGDLGPPDANYLDQDLIWHEGGVIEWRIGK